jgi:hypothetical protein
MPVQIQIQDLKTLLRRYNALLVECRSLENDLDDKVEPYFEREFKITQLRELTEDINETLSLIRESGYQPSEKELAGGFIITRSLFGTRASADVCILRPNNNPICIRRQ